MAETLVLSLKNNNIKKEEKILLAGEWVLEEHEDEIKNLNNQIFHSKSNSKKYRKIHLIKYTNTYKSI